ncbi:hypothetical protein QD46_21040 [Paenibacillus polymyxa]|nr:hypothetical protein QD46_21040 [Paenibacillus polymyxa]
MNGELKELGLLLDDYNKVWRCKNGLHAAGYISTKIRDNNLLGQIEYGYQDPQFARDEANKTQHWLLCSLSFQL